MYGLIGNFTARPGQRDTLVALMRGSADAMPGCRSYVVAIDPSDADTIWVTEVWDSAEAHKASLKPCATKIDLLQIHIREVFFLLILLHTLYFDNLDKV